MTVHVGVDATTWWNDRGFGRFTRELLKALIERATTNAGQRSDFRYTLLVDREPDGTLPQGANVLPIGAKRSLTAAAVGRGSRSLGDLFAASRVSVRERFDVFFFPAVYSYFPLISRAPTVVAFHDTIAERYPDLVFPTPKNRWFWHAKCRMAKWQAKRIMTVSQASAADIERFWGVSPLAIDTITEAADPVFRKLGAPAEHAALRSRWNIPDEARLLVYVGGLNPHKNLKTLLQALPAVLQALPDVHLMIVGDTSGRGFFDNAQELQTLVAADPRLAARVRFTGYLPDADLVRIYDGADALVFPSLWEGFGLPAVEAMACGVPVLASQRGSLPEVVADAGEYFDPLAPDSIAAVVIGVLGDAERRQALAERALLRTKLFTWDRAAALAERSFLRCLE